MLGRVLGRRAPIFLYRGHRASIIVGGRASNQKRKVKQV